MLCFLSYDHLHIDYVGIGSCLSTWNDELAQIDWINGTATFALSGDLQGKIVIVPGTWYTTPYDRHLRKLVPYQPAGVLVVKPNSATPGDGMYAVDGKDRRTINFPVVEAVTGLGSDPGKIREGTYLTIKVEKNQWKAAKDTVWPVLAASALSLCEACTMAIIIYRLHQFAMSSIPMVSIGPVCLVLELCATMLRFAYTIVDPFFVNRMLPYAISSALFTIHLPFTFASGALLTFYCTPHFRNRKMGFALFLRGSSVPNGFLANYISNTLLTCFLRIIGAETLRGTQIKASPFVSEYRIVAISVCVFIFIMEIVAIAVRLTSPKAYVAATYVTLIVYTIITIILTVCYIITATSILKRINEMGGAKTKRVRIMTIRFLLSAVTYIIFIIFEIAFGIIQTRPWGSVIIYPLLFVALDATTLLQVLGLRPIGARGRSTSKPSSRSTPISRDTDKTTDSLASQGV